MKRLYVGNLSYTVTSDDLQALFAQFGQIVSAEVIEDRHSGRSKGFGFVEFEDASQADAALSLNGQEYKGRKLHVSLAKEKTERTGGGAGPGAGGSRWRGNDRGGDRRGSGGFRDRDDRR
ncbi:MAG: hypothetical protein A2103_02490 [Gammaproteobacteria bacterium GWF2_41_13]|nr:MAG: hypothetical protein A2103_02490 [Gammaproteobacteria bacterium GWF2_41_13]